MSISNGLIIAPVGVHDDIPQTLGISSTDVGTQCVSDNVNMWTDRHPVAYDSIAPLSEEQFKSVHYGFENVAIIQPTLSNLTTKSMYYRQPISGTNAWYYRASDFDGYNHNAKPIFQFSFPANISPDSAVIININDLIFESSTSGQLSIDKIIGNGKKNQLGVAIFSRSRQKGYYKIFGRTITGGKLPLFLVDDSLDWEGKLSKDIAICLFISDNTYSNERLKWREAPEYNMNFYPGISNTRRNNVPAMKYYNLSQFPIQGYLQYSVVGSTTPRVNDNSDSYYNYRFTIHDKASAGLATLKTYSVSMETIDYNGNFRVDQYEIGKGMANVISGPDGSGNYVISVPCMTLGGKYYIGKTAYTNCYIYNTTTGASAGKLLGITLIGSA
jgi:hypothetical protein